jgi:hypothetical protein
MKKKTCIAILAVAAALLILSSQAMAYRITGYVNNPGNYTTSGSLWLALEGPGAFGADPLYPYQYPCYTDSTLPCITLPQPPYALNTINHNWVDSNYVRVTGEDGSSALYSVGELNPKFAPAASVVTLTCDKKGRCDLSGGGRWVHNVAEIEVAHAVSTIKISAGTPFTHFFSPILIVSGAGITPQTYDVADLQAIKQVTFDASASTTNTVGVWTGPTLESVLRASGVDTRDMDSYIVISATDGYAAVISMYEATHKTGGQHPLLAISASDNSINNGGKDSGLARFVLPNDVVAGRWVSNVAQIVVYKIESCEDHWR